MVENVRLFIDAARDGLLDQLQSILSSGVPIDSTDDDGCTALHMAASEGHHQVVTFLVNAGANRSLVDAQEFSTLHWATLSEDLETMSLSLTQQQGVDPKDVDSRTPLSWAVAQGSPDVVRWLIAHGSNPNSADRDGWTPLHYAAARNRVAMIDLLFQCDARLDAESLREETALQVAERLGSIDAAQALRAVTRD